MSKEKLVAGFRKLGSGHDGDLLQAILLSQARRKMHPRQKTLLGVASKVKTQEHQLPEDPPQSHKIRGNAN